jgi:hypothetical protein
MSKKIENPAKCEVRALIRFLNVQNVRPIQIYRQLIAVYGEGVMNESDVRKWCQMFNEGRTNVHTEQSGRLSLITEDLKNRILPTVWTWLQVIFSRSRTWSNFGEAHVCVVMKKQRRWLKTGSMDWRDFYDAGIQKLVTR